ncbi:MAG: hypothetical protein A2161_18665 [Candidatus Schekmanbacteria bacterium RBG_13_48_7]|uniref:HEAT repeat domain-containing protein n=1 Tax=Candidatus Schekmanbacteria bacterium RBG_13_48_7 TaxID=1817878 RepID=A0A1F7RLS1_9BACT|nr:MAG: hypothetical protein A2161_18665 [Candidatus Schekmanbacteria bacterium RBG_13_48_7]
MKFYRFLGIVIIFIHLIIFPCCAKKTDQEKKPSKQSEVSQQSGDVASLVQQLTKSRELRTEARKKLISLGKAATAGLISYKESSEFTIRWEIANILGSTKDPAGLDTLINFVLRDENPHVRWRSIWALSQHDDPSIGERFRSYFNDGNKTIRWNAAVGGSMFSVKETLPILKEGLSSPDDFTAWEAVNALSRIFDQESVKLLIPILEGSVERVRRESVLSLGKMKYPEARDLLIKYLSDKDPGVRWRSAMSLANYSDPSVRKALENQLKVEKDTETISQIQKSLQKYNDIKQGQKK